ncbi:MAG: hypothetical protein ACFB14_08640 [Leptolyngbyaceae cyanobacterium]
MEKKRLKIQNLDNLQELTPAEIFAIQGGITAEEVAPVELDVELVDAEDRLIYYPLPTDPIPYPVPCGGPRPHPRPRRPRPIKQRCFRSPYPTKRDDIPWCAVIL